METLKSHLSKNLFTEQGSVICIKCKKEEDQMFYLKCCNNIYFCKKCMEQVLEPTVTFSIEGLKTFYKQITSNIGLDIFNTKLTEISKETFCPECKGEITEEDFIEELM